MKCRIGFKQISFYIDGAYSRKKRLSLEAHFANCPHCKQALARARSLKASLYALDQLDLSPGFDAEFRKQLHSIIPKAKQGLFFSVRDIVSRFSESYIVPVPVTLKVAASLILVISLLIGFRMHAMSAMPFVEFSAGDVRIYRQSSDAWISPQPQLHLRQGDKIELKDGAVLNLASKARYKARIKNRAIVVVSRLESGLRNTQTDFSISQGKLLVNTTERFKGSGMRIFTPACDAEIVGTAFMVDVSENNTWLGVLEGKVGILSKPHPLKADTQSATRTYVAAGQKVFTGRYMYTTKPELLSSAEWKSMLELYQLIDDPQIMLLIGTGINRVNNLLEKPALLYIPKTLEKIIPNKLIQALYGVAKAADTDDLELVREKTVDLENLLKQYPDPLYSIEVSMFIASHFYYANDYESAIDVLSRVAYMYPDSEMASLAMSGMASIYQDDIKDTGRARQIYMNIIKLYPDSADAIRAKQALSSLR
jgi:hypothetical protein